MILVRGDSIGVGFLPTLFGIRAAGRTGSELFAIPSGVTSCRGRATICYASRSEATLSYCSMYTRIVGRYCTGILDSLEDERPLIRINRCCNLHHRYDGVYIYSMGE